MSSRPLRIGENAIWAAGLAGQIDEVRVYNRAPGADENTADMDVPVD